MSLKYTENVIKNLFPLDYLTDARLKSCESSELMRRSSGCEHISGDNFDEIVRLSNELKSLSDRIGIIVDSISEGDNLND